MDIDNFKSLFYNYSEVDNMKIGIASDHRGVLIKKKLKSYLEALNYEVIDYGTNSLESVHYPEFAFKVGEEVAHNNIEYGILLCGTGIGMSIACNKVKGVRCAKVDSKNDAYYARCHNNANVIALRSDFEMSLMKEIIKTFLETEFSNEERHSKRVEMIDKYV